MARGGELDLGFWMFNFSPQLRPRRRPRLWSGQVGVKTRLRVDFYSRKGR